MILFCKNKSTIMFVSHEKNVSKRKFQKPNILRRKPKIPAKSSNYSSVVTSPSFQDSLEFNFDSIMQANCVKSFQNLEGPVQVIHTESNVSCEDSNKSIGAKVKLYLDHCKESENIMFNIESELTVNSDVAKDKSQNEDINHIDQSDLFVHMVPLSAVTSLSPQDGSEQISETAPMEQSIEQPSSAPFKFQCDAPNCNKEFTNEQKFKKHKNIHNKVPRQITVECPVKKINEDGTEKSCGRIYLVRELLVKHLNEEHTLDDAGYRCSECGRRFFWASGLRSHARSHVPRTCQSTFTCSWPGCGRVFSQPCRLREHARAHTGDRPYPCRYPNCESSFRSASKLERHARRHAGLRRHACAACGRAFLRRDHLRDHQRRHRDNQHHYRCPQHGCEKTFSNLNACCTHLKKVHKYEVKNYDISSAENIDTSSLKNNWIYLQVDSSNAVGTESEPVADVVPAVVDSGVVVAEVEVTGTAEEGEDLRAARTHCPWPNVRQRIDTQEQYVFEDETNVEQPEGSESNIYTVRSDLFLHGNVLINEDSEHMGGTVGTAEATECEEAETTAEAGTEAGERGDSLADLGLLDAHHNIDLMQEEFMYTVWQ